MNLKKAICDRLDLSKARDQVRRLEAIVSENGDLAADLQVAQAKVRAMSDVTHSLAIARTRLKKTQSSSRTQALLVAQLQKKIPVTRAQVRAEAENLLASQGIVITPPDDVLPKHG